MAGPCTVRGLRMSVVTRTVVPRLRGNVEIGAKYRTCIWVNSGKIYCSVLLGCRVSSTRALQFLPGLFHRMSHLHMNV